MAIHSRLSHGSSALDVDHVDIAIQHRITRHAMETVAAAHTANSHEDLNRVFRSALNALGFSLFVGIEIVNSEEKISVNTLFGEGFEPWFSHYLQMDYAEDDCMIERAVRGLDSFFWSEVASRKHLSPRAMLIMEDARAFGLREGFVAPMHRTDSSVFSVLFAGEGAQEGDSPKRAAAHILSIYYGMLGWQLFQPSSSQPTRDRPLTERQRECLRWVRQGKSSTDIGVILGISGRVVDEHIAHACERLGVRTRMQAVFAANLKDYIDR
jgi:LuxR family quorum sensing-dependent transcriptional regulator